MKRRVAIAGLLLLCVGACLVGRGGQSQFSPETFEHRAFSYLYIPGTSLIFWTQSSQPTRSRIVQFWIDEGYVTPATTATQWDVIQGWGSSPLDRRREQGPAKPFCTRTNCASDGQAEDWIEWSRQQPKWAAFLWPRVIELLQHATGNNHGSVDYYIAACLMLAVRDVSEKSQLDTVIATWNNEFAAKLQWVR